MQQVLKTQGFTQFELTQKLLQHLNNFKLTPTAKLVLMYLSSCYNPKHGEMFPKQRTIADKIGVSEASVIRAISELHKEGLILSERKYTNRYVFTSKFLTSLEISTKKMQVDNYQNESKETCKLQPLLIEQKREQINKQKIFNSKIPYVDPCRYKTGELKRLNAINSEQIEKLPKEYFDNIRKQLFNTPSRSPQGESGAMYITKKPHTKKSMWQRYTIGDYNEKND